MKGSKLFFLLLLIFSVAFGSYAQQKTKAQLQKERTENLKKIKEAQATLKKTTTKRKASIGQLNAIKYQISVRQKLIRGMEEELTLLDKEIESNLEVIGSLEEDISALKEEYSAMLYAAYKARSGQNKLTFIFSSESFNQLLRRMAYLEQYSDARNKQVEQIKAVQQSLLDKNLSVEATKTEKSALMGVQKDENTELVSMQKTEQDVVAELRKEETKIKRELAKRSESIKALDKLINDIIRREAEEAARAATAANASSVALSEDFSKNKLKLPWPAEGFVSLPFGISRDPVLKMVERNSPGIEIQTKSSSEATAVFTGKVTKIALIPGFNKAVIIKHGDYYTVYAKLTEVYVKSGQIVGNGEKIGKIFTDSDGTTELHFEIWQVKENGAVKLDPERWLVKR
ncbi:MAG: peptidoglycan DD-metalloendopeptidase family protein [Bacteroidota bacterium]